MNETTLNLRHQYLQLTLTSIGFILLCALLQATNGNDWASMSKPGVQDGEYWRLLTGHLIHLDWTHYGMNMMGLSLCLVVYRDDIPAKHWLTSFIFIALFSSFCMFFTYFSYERYFGFSDVLHGWILVGALGIAHKEPKFSIMIFVLFWLKILEENMQLTFFTSYGVTGNVAKESHIYGAIGGILYSLIFLPSFRQTLVSLLKPKQQA